MISYNLFFKRSAEKELRKISKPDIPGILDSIRALSNQPRPTDTQILKGENRYFRIRRGDYRVVYEVDDAKQSVTIIKIGHRSEIYR